MPRSADTPGPSRRSESFARFILLLLVGGAVARIFLVLGGGRFFISDEGRYLHGLHLYRAVCLGDWPTAMSTLQHADNWGFILVTAVTTAIQHGLTVFTSHAVSLGDLSSLQATLFLGAIVLSLIPVATVWLVYRLALRLGADEREAFCGALILSFSNTAFYFSRHLFPYDASIAVAIGALLVAAGPAGTRRSLLAGALGGAAFHIYNAYWYLLPLIPLTRLLGVGGTRRGFVDSSLTVVGETLAVALPYAWGWWAYGSGFVASTLVYGRSVVQGLYREGWSFPAEYLWHSEGLFGILALALPIGIWLKVRSNETIPARVRYVFGSVVGIYVVWTIVSSVAHLFVLNARTVKPVVPLLCLLSGWGLAALSRLNLRLAWVAGILIAALGIINLAPHFWLVFPLDFEAVARAEVGNPKRTASVSGSYFPPRIGPVTAPDHVMVNVQYLYPIRSPASSPEGETILAAAHPLEYRPYQYDGFTPRQRGILRTTDIRMKLVRLTDPSRVPDLPPAEDQSGNADWPDGFDSEAEMEKKPTPAVR
jgi:hypothetical protein